MYFGCFSLFGCFSIAQIGSSSIFCFDIVEAVNTAFLQPQPGIEVVDSIFDLQSRISLIVTVINHSNIFIRLKLNCILGRLSSLYEFIESLD